MSAQLTTPSLFDLLHVEPPAPVLPDPQAPTAAVASDASDTSKAAALRALPRSGTQRWRVLRFIAERGVEGATDEEIQAELRLGHNSQTPRRRELVLGGWIIDSGRRRRTLSTNSEATVWVLTTMAKLELARAS